MQTVSVWFDHRSNNYWTAYYYGKEYLDIHFSFFDQCRKKTRYPVAHWNVDINGGNYTLLYTLTEEDYDHCL